MNRFLLELHLIKTEERYRGSLLFLRASCVLLGSVWLFLGYSASSWIGSVSWGMILLGFGPVTILTMMLALLARSRAAAFGLGLLAGSVLLIPLLPTNEWKAINIQTRGLQVGMSSDEACAIVGDLEPSCLYLAGTEQMVFLVPANDPSNDSALIRIEFSNERVSAISRAVD